MTDKWKKAEARKEMDRLAAGMARGLPVQPEVVLADGDLPRSWEWRIERGFVWTIAGLARFAVDVDHRFFHRYMQFNDVARALDRPEITHGSLADLNRHSGKWNLWGAPPEQLSRLVDMALADWEVVVVDDPAALAEALAAEEERTRRWREAMAA